MKNSIDTWMREIREALANDNHDTTSPHVQIMSELQLRKASQLYWMISEIADGLRGEPQDIRDYAQQQLATLPILPPPC